MANFSESELRNCTGSKASRSRPSGVTMKTYGQRLIPSLILPPFLRYCITFKIEGESDFFCHYTNSVKSVKSLYNSNIPMIQNLVYTLQAQIHFTQAITGIITSSKYLFILHKQGLCVSVGVISSISLIL